MSGNRRSDDVEMNSKYNSSTSSASSEDEPPTYKEVVQSKKQSTHRLIKLFIAAMAYYINTLDRQVWAKLFQSWGPFLKNMSLTPCQFSKKNLIRYVLWKVSNFALIFYLIRTLHKKSRQSLRPSTGHIG